MNVAEKKGPSWVLYMLPFLIGIGLFKVWPLIQVIVISFQEGYHFLTGTYDSIGFSNYHAILTDPYFQQAVINTAIYAVVVVPAVLCLSLPIAWCLLRVKRGLGFFQVALFFPFITSDIAIGMAWRILFSNNGMANYLLSLFGIESIGWLTDADMSLLTLTLYGIWSGLPMTILLFYCALLNMDSNLFIAARISGAGEMKIFRKLVLPMLRPTILMVFAINSVSACLTINGLFPLFMGQPGPYYNLYTLVYYIYDNTKQGKMGFAAACAAACVLLILVGFFQLLRILLQPKRRGSDGTHSPAT